MSRNQGTTSRTSQRSSPACVDFADVPGLGAMDCDGFPTDACPEEINLEGNHTITAKVLAKDPSIYAQLSKLRTELGGVSFARCIKPGMDRNGHPMIKTCGAYAGDLECYSLFRPFFEPVIRLMHEGFSPESGHRTDTDPNKVDSECIDSTGRYVFSARLALSRNLANFPLLPAISRQRRQEVECRLSGALAQLPLAAGEEMPGQYLPLSGSRSYPGRLGGMTEAEEQALREAKVLFEAPDSVLVLSSGLGRDWPEARAIFVTGHCATTGATRDTDLVAWINQEEHLQLRCQRKDADLKAAFSRVLDAERELQRLLERAHGQPAFAAPDSSFGHLSASPENVGTGLRVEVIARLPKLGVERGFRALCKRLQLQGKRAAEEGAEAWSLSNVTRVGITEVEQLNTIITGTRLLVAIEQRLERGDEGDFDAVTKAVLGA